MLRPHVRRQRLPGILSIVCQNRRAVGFRPIRSWLAFQREMADDEVVQRGRYTAQDEAFLADLVAKDVGILGAYGLSR
jgi:hypothetical protein